MLTSSTHTGINGTAQTSDQPITAAPGGSTSVRTSVMVNASGSGGRSTPTATWTRPPEPEAACRTAAHGRADPARARAAEGRGTAANTALTASKKPTVAVHRRVRVRAAAPAGRRPTPGARPLGIQSRSTTRPVRMEIQCAIATEHAPLTASWCVSRNHRLTSRGAYSAYRAANRPAGTRRAASCRRWCS